MQFNPPRGCSLFGLHPFTLRLAEPLPVLDGGDERLDHLGAAVVAAELFELREPEVEAVEVEPRLRRVVGVALEVAEVLHEDELAVELGPVERSALGRAPERRGATRG